MKSTFILLLFSSLLLSSQGNKFKLNQLSLNSYDDNKKNIHLNAANHAGFFDTYTTSFLIGFDFNTFPGIYNEYYGSGNDLGPSIMFNGFYFAMRSQGFRVEPYVAHSKSTYEKDYNNSSEDDYDYKVTNTQITVGFLYEFNFSEQSHVKPYAGVRIGKSWYSYEHSNDEDDEEDISIFSPCLGVEYFLGETKEFSFGGEISLKTISEHYESDNQGDFSYGYEVETTTQTMTPKFIVRYYF